jgi:hypothetical protein
MNDPQRVGLRARFARLHQEVRGLGDPDLAPLVDHRSPILSGEMIHHHDGVPSNVPTPCTRATCSFLIRIIGSTAAPSSTAS